MKNLTIKLKLIIIVCTGLIALSTFITVLSITQSKKALLEIQMEKLSAVQSTKHSDIKNYLGYLKGLLTSLAGQRGTQDAFIAFEDGFNKLQSEVNLDISMVKRNLKSNFKNEYLNNVNYDVPNSKQKRSIDSYLPDNENALVAQYIFITDNSAKLGNKNKMTYNSKYKSTFMSAHKKYHQSFNKFLTAYGLYDIFMVDLKGTVIYTDFKEKDFATNLRNGIYSNTGLARAYKKGLNLSEGDLGFDDFQPYEPSYNMAAAFISSPIFINGVKKGILIFQMPVDKINSIMRFDGKFEEAGLGKSGESYLVGEDYKMRSNSRFQKDIKDKIVQDLGSTVGVMKIKTKSVEAVMNGETKIGKWIIPNYRNINVLSVYSKIDVYGQSKWAIIAEINEEEALKHTTSLQNTIVISSMIIFMLIVFTILYFIDELIVKPINNFQLGLLNFFKYLNKETTSTKALEEKCNDEIGIMAKVINENILKTKALISEEQIVISAVKNVVEIAKNGQMKQSVSVTTHNKELDELRVGFNELLEVVSNKVSGNLNQIHDALHFYKNLDFTHRISGNLGEVSIGLNNLADDLYKAYKKLAEKEDELRTLNINLEKRIIQEVEKSKIQQKQILDSAKLIQMGEMIGNIAHQWRQPLSVITTSATGMIMQKEYGVSTEDAEIKSLNSINKNAQYLSSTIDDFRNYIRDERKCEHFNLNETVNSFLHLVDSSIKHNNLDVVVNLEEDIKLNGYSNELIQCFINIFNNARDVLKEQPEDHKLLFIVTTQKKEDKVVIKFKDSGYGISENILDKIFEPYFTTKYKSQGTGLGLHMVYNIITQGMNGTIDVANVTYEHDGMTYTGAEFTITLPI